MKEYPDPCADEALAVLTAIAALCKVDIAQIECQHAAVRRFLKTRTQTHVMSFEELSGQFKAQRHRSGKIRYAPSHSSPKPDAKARRQRSEKQMGWKSSGGGGQRKYFSVQLRARKLGMQTQGVVRMLHAEYAALTPEERAPCVRDGEAATQRWRTTEKRSTSFGLPRRRRHARVNAQAQRRVALWNRLHHLPPEARMCMLADSAIPEDICGEDYLKAVSAARAVARHGAKRQRHEFADGERALSEWRAARTPAAARAFTSALGVAAHQSIGDRLAVALRALWSRHGSSVLAANRGTDGRDC